MEKGSIRFAGFCCGLATLIALSFGTYAADHATATGASRAAPPLAPGEPMRTDYTPVGDFDGDGRTDLLAIDVIGKTISWRYLPSTGDSSWQELHQSETPLDSVLFGDFDGDEKTDFFRLNFVQWQVLSGGVGEWQVLRSDRLRFDAMSLGDFDGDGRTDVFTAARRSWQVSSGASEPWQTLGFYDASAGDIAFGDFDGDGRTDVFDVSRTTGFRYSPGGNEPWVQLARHRAHLAGLRFGDFDGDGRTDVFSIGVRPDGRNKWQFSSAGVSDWREMFDSDLPLRSLRFGDFDGDGRTDVLTVTNQDGEMEWKYSPAGMEDWVLLGQVRTSPGAGLATDVITACVETDGSLRRVAHADECASDETALAWNIAGEPGPRGERGPMGQAGQAGATGSRGPAGPAGKDAAGEDVICNLERRSHEANLDFELSESCMPTHTIDTAFHMITFMDVAVTESGLVRIVYNHRQNELSPYSVRLAICEDATCSRSQTTTVATEALGASIALNGAGLPVISYIDRQTDALKLALCADSICSSSTVRTIDDGPAGASSVIVGADGRPFVAYRFPNDGGVSQLRVAHCSNATCTSTRKSVIHEARGTGHAVDAALGADGLPFLAFIQDGNSGGLRNALLAHCKSAACTSSSVIDLGWSTAASPTVQIAQDGFPRIAYRGVQPGRLLVTCENTACSGHEAARSSGWPQTKAGTNFTRVSPDDFMLAPDGRSLFIRQSDEFITLRDCPDDQCGSKGNITVTHVLEEATPNAHPKLVFVEGKPLIFFVERRRLKASFCKMCP